MLAKITEQESGTSHISDSLSTQSVVSIDDTESASGHLQASGWSY